jgi:hypothetical protein
MVHYVERTEDILGKREAYVTVGVWRFMALII